MVAFLDLGRAAAKACLRRAFFLKSHANIFFDYPDAMVSRGAFFLIATGTDPWQRLVWVTRLHTCGRPMAVCISFPIEPYRAPFWPVLIFILPSTWHPRPRFWCLERPLRSRFPPVWVWFTRLLAIQSTRRVAGCLFWGHFVTRRG